MKFSILRENLLKPLQLVQSVVEKRQTALILGNVLLDLEGNLLRLSATDLEMEMTVTVPGVSGERDGRATVSARKLMDICRASSEGALVRAQIDGDRIAISSGRAKFFLATLPASDFPVMPLVRLDGKVSTSQTSLRALVAGTYFAMAQQDVRYYLNGTLLEFGTDSIRLVATDGHRLSVGEIQRSETGSFTRSVIVPRKTVIELQKLLDSSADEAKLELGSDQLSVRLGEVLLRSKLIEGSFPDYEKVIPKGHPGMVVVNRGALLGALGRAAILSSERLRSVRIEVSNGQIKVSARNSDNEESDEIVEVEYSGQNVEIGFNSSYLMEALDAISDEEVQMQLKDSSSSVLLQGLNSAAFRYVVMPMKL